MLVKRLYSTLNIMYLKLIQYEKYLSDEDISNCFEQVDFEIEKMVKKYDSTLRLSKLSLDEMFRLCLIEARFNYIGQKSDLKNQFETDLLELNMLGYKLSWWNYQKYTSVFTRPYLHNLI